MQPTHDGMTIAQRRLLQFWLDATTGETGTWS